MDFRVSFSEQSCNFNTAMREQRSSAPVAFSGTIQGPKGDPGYTPQRGIDYWTDEDKESVENDIFASAMMKRDPTGTGSFSMNRKADTTVGGYSFAEGYDTTASGVCSHAEGAATTASGDCSHAEGNDTTASGTQSHAEGGGTSALGLYSHAEGNATTARGHYSHAEGYRTTASGSYSHAEGDRTIAIGDYSHAQGKYNVETTAGAFADIVGWGTADNARKNISSLTTEGDLHLAGDVYVGANADGTGGTKLGTGGASSWDDLTDKPFDTIDENTLIVRDGVLAAAPVDVPTTLAELTDDATHRTVTDAEKTAWSAKSDFSGNYDDLENKPTIPAEQVNADWNAESGKAQILNKPTIPEAVTEVTVSGWGFTKNTGTYSKPSGGIPKTDLASAVQTSLGKADTALQSVPSGYATEAYVDSHHDDTKQNVISDLATIRSGAALGATAVQPESGKGLFSGSYNDLTNKPTIPSAVTESTVSGWGFTKNTGTYSKPSGGIPKSDLASAVKTSLEKADSALQSVPSGYATEAYVDSHHDNTKQDTLTAGSNITIVGNVISSTGGDTEEFTNAEVDTIWNEVMA